MKAKSERRPRSVPAVYGLASLAILIAVATLALVVSPPGPPALAEFAPRAEDRIDEALKAQSSSFGTGNGGDCAAGQECAAGGDGSGGGLGVTTTTTGPKNEREIDVARVRRCVGDPPRQTEDPQSPPCVNYFEGDNGGATTRGVTRDEILVAVPEYLDNPNFEDFVDHFNKRYELYGRKLRIVKMPRQPGDSNTTGAPVDAAAEAHAFAYLTFYLNDLDASEVQAAAARRHIVSVNPYANQTTSDRYRELAPYAWSFAPAADEMERDLGDLACTSLNGKTADFARGDLRVKERRFGVLRSTSSHPLDLSGLNAALRRCGIAPPPVYDIHFKDDRDAVLRTYLSMKDAGITTLLLVANADDVTQWASKLPGDFQPEWVVSGLAVPEQEGQWNLVMPSAQHAGLFGAFTPNKLLAPADVPALWAYREDHPDDTAPDPSADRRNLAMSFGWTQEYRALLLLASGIQLAGPKLTPETFAQGLQRARFPNPGAGTGPYYQARVGFGPGDYTMSSGSAVVWWADSAPAYGSQGVTRQGGWCYVQKGARFERDWVDVSTSLFDPNPANCR
ncbi:MAG: hypothetical protein QOI20_650 [Acidimicrobiaceae bacterium]|jgi:hypothetical protein|nr:hypothetical protein [Acidimicrobiaceae bacterium]